jgi:hypothetical protein
VRQYFDLDTSPFIIACQRAGLSQADLVLCLMRINTNAARNIAEGLIGKEITVGPACLLRWAYNKQAPSISTQPVITFVQAHPLLRKKSRLDLAYREFKCGRTLQQLRARGITRGDLRRAMKQGIIKMVGL